MTRVWVGVHDHWIPEDDAVGGRSGPPTFGSGTLVCAPGEALYYIDDSNYTIRPYHYRCGEMKVEDYGTPPTAAEAMWVESNIGVVAGPRFFTKLQDAGFVIELRERDGTTILQTGLTVYSFATWYEYRIEEGPSGRWRIDFGTIGAMDVDEIDVLYIATSNSWKISSTPGPRSHYGAIGGSGGSHSFRHNGLAVGGGRFDRPQSCEIIEKPHDDNTPQLDDYNLSGGSDKSVLVDDWQAGGDSDEDTTHLISDVAADETDDQTLTTGTEALANVEVVKVYLSERNDIDVKISQIGAVIADGTSGRASQTSGAATDSWRFTRYIFNSDANGDPWDQDGLDLLEYGHTITDGGDITNARVSAISAVALGADDDGADAELFERPALAGTLRGVMRGSM